MDIGLLKEIKKPQITVLKTLALDGPGNIQELHKRIEVGTGYSYVTTLRAVRELWSKRLIFLSNIQDRGPKSAQEYSLFTVGIAASFLLCDLNNELNKVCENWGTLTPNAVKHFQDFEKAGMGDLARRVLGDVIVLHLSYTRKAYEKAKKEMSELFCIPMESRPYLKIQFDLFDRLFLKLMLDRCFFEDLDYEPVISIVNSDPAYRVFWKDYIERLRFDVKIFREAGKKFQIASSTQNEIV